MFNREVIMDKKEIIQKIDSLRDELLRLDAKDVTFAETIAYLKQRQAGIVKRRKTIHNEINALKVEILKIGL